jgi:glycosyltransferase involved in cell wall biosynthesis
MSNHLPIVSIGLPVYNGETYLAKTLDSLLAQTWTDFELIISDNGSTDKTEAICREYAAKEPRILYERQSQNLGASWNFNRVFALSQGKYFKWHAHDDLCAPEFLAKCVTVLEQDSSVVLCHSQVKVIDRQGNFFDSEEAYVKHTNANLKLNTDSSQSAIRFRALISFSHSCYQVFGLIRRDILAKTPLIDNYAGSDRVLLAKLGLFGRFAEIPAELFFLRRHPEQSINICARSMHWYNIWHDPKTLGKITFPYWRIYSEYFKTVNQVPLSWQERFECYRYLQELLTLEEPQLWKLMRRDVIIAAIQILTNTYSRLNLARQSSHPSLLAKSRLMQIAIALIENIIKKIYLRLNPEISLVLNSDDTANNLEQLIQTRYPTLGSNQTKLTEKS